jgi:hypothetical protein
MTLLYDNVTLEVDQLGVLQLLGPQSQLMPCKMVQYPG